MAFRLNNSSVVCRKYRVEISAEEGIRAPVEFSRRVRVAPSITTLATRLDLQRMDGIALANRFMVGARLRTNCPRASGLRITVAGQMAADGSGSRTLARIAAVGANSRQAKAGLEERGGSD